MATPESTTANLSSFKTGGRRHLFTYTWKIENLVFWAKKSDEYLETDVFRPRLIDDGIWRLRLYPRRRDETLLWYLERVFGERAETVYANFKITMSTGRVVHYEYHSNNYPFKKGSGAASATEKKLKDILSEGSLTTDPEPLTIVCQMSRRCSSVALAERLSSSTRIEIGKLTFSWHFGQFSKWNPADEHTLAGYTYGNAVYDILSCKMHLYDNRDPKDERLGIIIRFRRPPAEDFLVVAKVSVLDVHGKAVITYDETYFEKAGDDTIVWVTPAFIEKKRLTDAAELYLPNDELTLLSEFKIPVKNIYAVRLQYSLASNAALHNIVERNSVKAKVPHSSIGTQTILETKQIEIGTQTEIQSIKELFLNDKEAAKIFVLSLERGRVVLEDAQKTSLSKVKMAKNLVYCKEELIDFYFDSDDVKDGEISANKYVYYPKNEKIESCLELILAENSDNKRYFTVVDYCKEDNNKRSEDKTFKIEKDSFITDTTIGNFQLKKQQNFAKEQTALTDDICGEVIVTITENDKGSQNMSSKNDDSEDYLTSKKCSDDPAEASTSEDDVSVTGWTTDDSEYYEEKRRKKLRRNPQLYDPSDFTHLSEEERLLGIRIKKAMKAAPSKIFKGFLIFYFVTIFLYFYFHDAITYATTTHKVSPPSLKINDANPRSEFVKQLIILYAETLEDQATLDFVRGYTKPSNFPNSNLSTENAWVLLALADAHQDEELDKMVMEFLNANKATTLDSLAWREQVGSRILKAHAVFRQMYATKPTIEQLKV